jgi:hypothetical protein
LQAQVVAVVEARPAADLVVGERGPFLGKVAAEIRDGARVDRRVRAVGDGECHLHVRPIGRVAPQVVEDRREGRVVGSQGVEIGDAGSPPLDVLGSHALPVVEVGRRHRVSAPEVRLVAVGRDWSVSVW